MKKLFKNFKYVLCLLLILPSILLFSACSSAGLSAYEIAVKNGFKGTEQEWIASLQGEKGDDGTDGVNGKDAENVNLYSLYETAKNNGEFDGTFLEFLSRFVTDANVAQAVANENILSVYTIYAYESASSLTPAKRASAVLYSYTDTGAFVITNAHVTNITSTTNFDYFTLGLYGQDSTKRIPATFVGSSKTYDLAVVYVADKTPLVEAGAKPVKISTTPAIAGTGVISIGNTEGAGIAVSKGMVSVESEEWKISLFSGEETFSYRVLRHDSYIAPGNSGGGLFDYSGNLVGITNGGATNIELINFAIPASTVKPVIDNIIFNCFESENKKIQKCVLGINVSVSDTTTKLVDGVAKITDTLKITGIVADGAVDKAGKLSPENELSINDRLYSLVINQKEYVLSRSFELGEALLIPKPNDSITLKFIKDGETEPTTLNIILSADNFVEVI